MSRDNITRRQILRNTAVGGTFVGIAGCSGDGGSGDGGSGGGGSGGGETSTPTEVQTTSKSSDGMSISKPWTLEKLKEKSKEEADGGNVNFNAYTTTDTAIFRKIISAVKEGQDAPWIKYSGVAGNGNKMLTRYLEEAKSDRGSSVDLLQVRNIFAQPSVDATKYVEGGLRDKFAVAEELPNTVMGENWYGFKEGGNSVNILYNTEMVEEQGIDITPLEEKGYAALHEEDQYKGKTISQDFTPKERLMGWWAARMGEKAGMGPIEYAKMMSDRFQWNWTDGHSASSRFVGGGGAMFQLLTIPDHFIEFQDKGLPVDIVLPQKSPKFTPPGGAASIPKEAPNPWTARFVTAALFSPSVQRKIPELAGEPPVRTDIEYPDMDPRQMRLLEAPTEKIDLETKKEWQELSPKIMEQGFGSPQA